MLAGQFRVHQQRNGEPHDRQVRRSLLAIEQPADKGGIETGILGELVLALATQPGEIVLGKVAHESSGHPTWCMAYLDSSELQ